MMRNGSINILSRHLFASVSLSHGRASSLLFYFIYLRIRRRFSTHGPSNQKNPPPSAWVLLIISSYRIIPTDARKTGWWMECFIISSSRSVSFLVLAPAWTWNSELGWEAGPGKGSIIFIQRRRICIRCVCDAFVFHQQRQL